MLRFSLGRIPVTIHPSHLIIAALFGYMMVGPGSHLTNTFTGEVIARTGAPDYARWATFAVAGWMVIIFVSVLAHELGHALASVAFGFRPTIHLAWLGGHTVTGMTADLAWFKRVAVILAGPVAGALAGLVAGVAAYALEAHPFVEYLLVGMAVANAFWAILNLLPVSPLDGAQITTTVMMRMMGKRGFLVAQIIALVVGGALTLLALRYNLGIFAIFIFGMGTVEAFRAISAYRRGELESSGEASEALATLQRAHEALRGGDLERASTEATALLDPQTPEAIRSKAHHLLGWISLRRHDGKSALEHFGQLGSGRAEPEALATAYSLEGDDRQAAMLWELAYRENKNPRTAEAWAAALVLAQQPDAASRVPGVPLAGTYLAASRVAFERREYPTAARLAERSLELSPTNQAAYDAACAYAQLGKPEEALALLEQARQLGFSEFEHATSDPDLRPLHGHPGFAVWVTAGADSPRA